MIATTGVDLAAKLAAEHDFVTTLHANLIADAPAGYVIDSGVDAALSLAAEVLATIARAVTDNQVWMSSGEADEMAAYKRDLYAGFEANPTYVVTAELWAAGMRTAFNRGADTALNLTDVAA